jgi:exosortase/archaeosortase family protein
MGRRKKKGNQRFDKRASTAAPDPGGKRKSSNPRVAISEADHSWFQSKRPVLRFVMLFGVFMGLFFAGTITPYAQERAWPAYLRMNAEVSAGILRLFGEQATTSAELISSPRGSLRIARGCDAVQPSALFIAAVLASPVSMWAKLPGVVIGTASLILLNLIRIVSLFYVQIHFPRAFEVMHIEVWQVLFIFVAIALWAWWAWWAVHRRGPTSVRALKRANK